MKQLNLPSHKRVSVVVAQTRTLWKTRTFRSWVWKDRLKLSRKFRLCDNPVQEDTSSSVSRPSGISGDNEVFKVGFAFLWKRIRATNHSYFLTFDDVGGRLFYKTNVILGNCKQTIQGYILLRFQQLVLWRWASTIRSLTH